MNNAILVPNYEKFFDTNKRRRNDENETKRTDYL
jgi:hypothetical protein